MGGLRVKKRTTKTAEELAALIQLGLGLPGARVVVKSQRTVGWTAEAISAPEHVQLNVEVIAANLRQWFDLKT
jgi:hypothetical protein